MNSDFVAFGGWPRCVRLSNGIVDLIVTTDIGPRIVRFGFEGEANEFRLFDELAGQTGGSEWRGYGGHRLWHAPEVQPRTYAPDNDPVTVTTHAGRVRFTQPVEGATGIEKEMELWLAADAAHVHVVHRLRNRGLWPVTLAPWAISVMAPGGTAIFSLPPRRPFPEALQPTGLLALWSYTDLGDPRWGWGHRFVLLRQDSGATGPQKIGAAVPAGWVAYHRADHLFVKRFRPVAGARYPDLGCSVEVYTDSAMLEVETLGPLVTLEPGSTTEHEEHWHLFRDVPPIAGDEEVEQHVLPKIEALQG